MTVAANVSLYQFHTLPPLLPFMFCGCEDGVTVWIVNKVQQELQKCLCTWPMLPLGLATASELVNVLVQRQIQRSPALPASYAVTLNHSVYSGTIHWIKNKCWFVSDFQGGGSKCCLSNGHKGSKPPLSVFL